MSADDTLPAWMERAPSALSAEDAAALAKLRLRVEAKGGEVRCAQMAGERGAPWRCVANYTRRTGAVLVRVSVEVDAPTPAAAILACGEALGVAL